MLGDGSGLFFWETSSEYLKLLEPEKSQGCRQMLGGGGVQNELGEDGVNFFIK